VSTLPPAAPPPIQPVPPRSGCGKRVLVGCGIAALAVAALCLGLILYVRSKPQVITDFVMRQVESHYASDVTETDKRELRDAYAEFRKALVDGRVRKEPLERMRTTLMTGGGSDINHEQVREMIRLFRDKGGSTPSSPPVEITEPAPVSPRPTP